jgi:hypothetical protein
MLSRRPDRIVARGTALVGAALVLLLAGPGVAQGPGQPPMDPRAMSGVPRVDAQTEAGTLVVRVLRGSFQNPGVGLTVNLELRSLDGSKLETRTAVSVEQGRASFADLGAYAGGTAVASVAFEGEVVRSQAVKLDPNVGVRMLLVQGAAASATTTAAPVPGDVPMPGTAFANPGQPPGSVVVGTLDLTGGRPFVGVEVTLEVAKPDAPLERRTAQSDARGAARFADLADLPAGTKLVAEATLNGEKKRSEPFSLTGQEHGLAVVLAVTGAGASSGPPEVAERRPLQTPRAVPTLPAGTVRATIFGPDDRPVVDTEVVVVRLDVTGTRSSFAGVTGPDGVARVEGIGLVDDSLYQVEVPYSGAPFRSRLFRMDERMGVMLELRVFPTTSDTSKIRSAVQFGVEALENDQARVVQLHQALVEGDKAFWPTTPLRISGPADAAGMVVLDRATVELDHKEGAPFATLSEPLPPGEMVDLSIAYLMPHRGALALRWSSPFPVANGRVVLTPELKVKKGAQSGPVRPPHQEGQGPVEFDLYELGPLAAGARYDLEIEGLVTTPRTFRHLGLALGFLILFGTGLAAVLSPRASLVQRLGNRRDTLLRQLDRLDADVTADKASRERQRVIMALDQVYRQLDALAPAPAAGARVDVGAAWDRKA